MKELTGSELPIHGGLRFAASGEAAISGAAQTRAATAVADDGVSAVDCELTQGAPFPRLSAADWVTLGYAICGLLAIATALGKFGTLGGAPRSGLSESQLVVCTAFILFGAALDIVDGAVARFLGSSGMGDALDIMGDVLTFGVAPAVVLTTSRTDDPQPWRAAILVAAFVFVVAAMLRLARFAALPGPPGGGFYGLATPSGGGALLALSFVHPDPQVSLVVILIVSGLMISTIRYPHPARRTFPLLGAYGLLLSLALAGFLPTWPVALLWLLVIPLIPVAAAIGTRRGSETVDVGTAEGAAI